MEQGLLLAQFFCSSDPQSLEITRLHPDDGVDEEEDAHQEADIGQGLIMMMMMAMMTMMLMMMIMPIKRQT